MDPKYSDGIYANAEKTAIVLKGVFGFDEHGGEISGPVIATKDDPDTGDLFKQAISKAKPFGPIADYVAPVVALPVITAPRWKVRAVLKGRVLDGETVSTFDKIEAVIADALANSVDGAHVLYEAWSNASDIASNSDLVARFASIPEIGMSVDDVRAVLTDANKIAG